MASNKLKLFSTFQFLISSKELCSKAAFILSKIVKNGNIVLKAKISVVILIHRLGSQLLIIALIINKVEQFLLLNINIFTGTVDFFFSSEFYDKYKVKNIKLEKKYWRLE